MGATVLSERFFDSEKEWRCHNQHQYKKKVAVPAEDPPHVVGPSNLHRFLDATTPSVPARFLSKTQTWRKFEAPFFLLSDLWDSFEEWSVYGAGVPIVANGCDSMVQYYVPYLSGMQLYGEPKRQWVESRHWCADSDDSDSCYPESSSDGSSDSEHERVMNNGRVASDRRASLHDSKNGGRKSELLFEYLEHNSPYTREPLSQKINSLVREFPILKSARSSDLSHGSWISVAWYPIYRIPTGNTLRDIEACFLTYHSLSTPAEGFQRDFSPYVSSKEGVPVMSLPVFGLASYKFKPTIWTPDQNHKQTATSLRQAADKWLQGLDVYHPDFQFFISHPPYRK